MNIARQVLTKRPAINGEEFDRMLAKREAVVENDRARSWRGYLRGLDYWRLRRDRRLQPAIQ